MLGEFAALGASVCWALSASLFGRVGGDLDALSLAAVQCVTVAVVMALGLAIGRTPFFWSLFEAPDLYRLTISGIAGLAIGEVAYFRSLVTLGPRLSLMCWSLAPGATVLIAFLWAGARPSLVALSGIAVTLVGIVLTLVGRRREPETRFRAEVGGAPADSMGTSRNEHTGLRTLGWALLGPLLMGVSFTALGRLTTTHAPLETHAVRFASAAVPLVAVAVLTGRLPKIARALRERRQATLVFAAIGLGTLIGSGLATYSVLATDASTAITLASLGPVVILPLTRRTEATPLTTRTVVGAVIAVAGAAVVALS